MLNQVHVLQSVAAMNMGGIENYVMNLYRNIDRTKVQFDFVYAIDEDCYFDDEIRSMGGRIYKFQSPNKHPFAARRFYDDIFKNHPEIKVLHEHSSALSGNLATFSSAKASGIIRRAIHSHSSSAVLVGGFQGAVMRYNMKRNVERIENLATDFFACSDKASEWMFPHAGSRGIDVRLIKNGIDVRRFSFNSSLRSSIRRELGISSQTFVIGNVARLVEVKNQIFLVELLHWMLQRTDAALLIVGNGPLRKSIESEALRLNIADRVHLVGEQDDPAPYYSAMDLLCMPSLYEGLPVSCVEAQCNGLPLLLADTVSRDVAFTDRVVFQSLTSGSEEWCDRALSIKTSLANRNDGVNETIQAGFDINEAASFLQDYYLS